MNLITTACFTGHRPDKLIRAAGGDQAVLEEIRHRLQEKILLAVDDGFTTFLCGMAQGVDIWAGEIVLSLQESFPELELIAVLPYPGQEKSWEPYWKQRYLRLLKLSSQVIAVSPVYHKGCFLQRDRYMADHASRLIGVWMKDSPGGTGYTVHYAESRGLDLDLVLLENKDVL